MRSSGSPRLFTPNCSASSEITQASSAWPTIGQKDKRFPALLLLLLAVALVSTIVAIGVGAVEIAPGMVVAIIRDALSPGSVEPSWTPGQHSIVIDLRIPRAILGATVGAGLAIVGAVLQNITRNPLADPYLFGVSSGAAVGAVIVILYTGSVLGLVTPAARSLRRRAGLDGTGFCPGLGARRLRNGAPGPDGDRRSFRADGGDQSPHLQRQRSRRGKRCSGCSAASVTPAGTCRRRRGPRRPAIRARRQGRDRVRSDGDGSSAAGRPHR
jgi:hypothetical protein